MGKVLIGALLATLAKPATWPLALAAFLLRGGILVVALPIVVLPTTVGLGNAVAPALMPVAFGSISPGFVLGVGAIVIGLVAWLIVGGWLAALLEAEAARIVAGDEDLAAASSAARSAGASPGALWTGARVATRILAARLVASIPLAIALAFGAVRLLLVAYRELTSPLEVATPIVLRVLAGAPDAVIAVAVTWMLAEIVGGLAARRIVIAGAGIRGACSDAVASCRRRPLAILAWFWLPTVVLVLVLVPAALAAASAVGGTGAVLSERMDPSRLLGSVIVFVALWGVGLVLTSVVCAWRGAVWTVEGVTGEGTFGGSATHRPGH